MTRPRMQIAVQLLTPAAQVPTLATPGAAGFDLYSVDTVAVPPGARTLVHTGIALEVPPGWEAQVRARSGLALKFGIQVLNSPGTIDSDYRGPVGVILHNSSHASFTVNQGDRIAQLVFNEVPSVRLIVAPTLSATERVGGFGSTGIGSEDKPKETEEERIERELKEQEEWIELESLRQNLFPGTPEMRARWEALGGPLGPNLLRSIQDVPNAPKGD